MCFIDKRKRNWIQKEDSVPDPVWPSGRVGDKGASRHMWCVVVSKQSNDIKLENVTWDFNLLKKRKTLCLPIKYHM